MSSLCSRCGERFYPSAIRLFFEKALKVPLLCPADVALGEVELLARATLGPRGKTFLERREEERPNVWGEDE